MLNRSLEVLVSPALGAAVVLNLNVWLGGTVASHEGGEGFVVLPAGDAFFSDPDSLEEGLVHKTSFPSPHTAVGQVAAVDQADSGVGVGLEPFLAGQGGIQSNFELVSFGVQPGLLHLEEVEWYGVGVVGLKQFDLLSFDSLQPVPLVESELLQLVSLVRQLGQDDPSGDGDALGIQLYLAVLLGDLLFHQLDGPGPESAVSPSLLATDAEVIRIEGAELTLGIGHDQT